MKKLLILLSATILICSCNKEPDIAYALISGEITNPVGDKLTVNRGDFKSEITINPDGSFRDTLDITSGYYYVSQGRERTRIYLEPGYDLTLELDTKQFDETIKYSGVGSENNNYLASKQLNNESLQGIKNEFYAMNEKAFTSRINEINESNLKRLNSEGISEEFKSLEKENLKFDYYLLLNSYERNHSYYAKKEGFKVSDKFLPEDLKNMVYDNASYYANFEAYQRLASSKVMDDLFEDIGDNFQSVSPEQLAIIAKSPILALKNEIAKSIGVFLISPGNPNMEGVYTFFDGITSNDEVKRELKKKFEINKKLLPGMDSPTFTDYENHAGGSNSLEDYKGKFVYVDVWATWCGPCKREIPYLKDIENEYHGKNIVFLSTSIDRAVDYDKWKKMVKDEELQGVQLLADSDWQSQFVKEYAINGIPRFLLIDPEGKIVSADAPRPSNPKLKELFNKLNI